MKTRVFFKRLLFWLAGFLLLWTLVLSFPIYPVAKWMARTEMVRVLEKRGLDPKKLGKIEGLEMGNSQWAFIADYNGEPPMLVGVRVGYYGGVEYFSERKDVGEVGVE